MIAPDIGGGFGMKLNVYSDEIATVVASMLLGRPVKFCVDRLESFVSDAQARDHRIKCRIALKKTGEITGHGDRRYRRGRRLRHAAALQRRRRHDGDHR